MPSFAMRFTALLIGVLTGCLLAAAAPPAAALAVEEVTRFDSQLEIQPDGAVLVTETIEVLAEGRQIKHGIVRDFELTDGERMLAFQVLGATRNAHPEPYTLSHGDGGLKVYLGAKDELLAPGRYTYTLRYQAENAVALEDGTGELRWNVTGDAWKLPIRAVAARVVAPPGVDTTQLAAQALGGAAAATVTQARNGVVKFASSRPLDPGVGFTVQVQYPLPAAGSAAAGQRSQNAAQPRGGGIPWTWLLIGGALLWWWLSRRKRRSRPEADGFPGSADPFDRQRRRRSGGLGTWGPLAAQVIGALLRSRAASAGQRRYRQPVQPPQGGRTPPAPRTPMRPPRGPRRGPGAGSVGGGGW